MRIIVLIIIFLTISPYSIYAKGKNGLSFHDVTYDCNIFSPEEYDVTTELKDSIFKSNEKICIKRGENISFTTNEITQIRIKKMANPITNSSNFIIIFTLSGNALKKMNEFSRMKYNSEQAIFFNGSLLSIFKILSVVKNDFALFLFDTTHSDIISIFKPVFNKVLFE